MAVIMYKTSMDIYFIFSAYSDTNFGGKIRKKLLLVNYVYMASYFYLYIVVKQLAFRYNFNNNTLH